MGLDIGASEIYVCVPPGGDEQSVRVFATFTADLAALAPWLNQCGVTTVAMESTGVYWIAIFQILEQRGFEVYLVNAQYVKNLTGRKTDILDCRFSSYTLTDCYTLRSALMTQPVPYAPWYVTGRCCCATYLKLRRMLYKMCATCVGRLRSFTVKLKQLTGVEACQCRKARIQRNHIACALLVWSRLKALAYQTGKTGYQIKHGMLSAYLIEQLKNPSVQMTLA